MKWIAFAMVIGRGFDHDAAAENRLAECFEFLNPSLNNFSYVRDCGHISECELCRQNHDSPFNEISPQSDCHKRGGHTCHSPCSCWKKGNDTYGPFLSRHGVLREQLDNVVRQTSVEEFLK